jgi:glycosyltransferase involved in cell wall biosynthesis
VQDRIGEQLSVSVVVEGYNESLDIGCLDETIEALSSQTYSLSEVELILVGSRAQIEAWQDRFADLPFHSVRFLSAEGSHYYELKNRGARLARAPIVALTDSDVAPDPDWLRALVDGVSGGRSATAGVSLFRGTEGQRFWQPLLDAASSISWGFMIGPVNGGPARGFLSHNLGCRANLFAEGGYRDDLGRTCAGSFLFADWRDSGVNVWFDPRQRVAHAFNLRWWVTRLHVRFGHEVYRLRRINSRQDKRWVRFLGPLEPLATFGWHVVLDLPQWWKFGRLLGHSSVSRALHLPLVLGLSVAARGGEMAGMYMTMFAPRAAQRFAQQN